MITNKTNIKEISIPEALCNSNGKTSISAILGSFCILSGVIYMGIGIYAFFQTIAGADNILLQSLALTTLGSTMIVVKKLKPTKDITNSNQEDYESDINTQTN